MPPHRTRVRRVSNVTTDGVYTRTFQINGGTTGVSITGRIGCDDSVLSATLNGQPISVSSNGFATWANISITSGFQTGTNTLQFVVNNRGSGPNASGFRAELAVYGASPSIILTYDGLGRCLKRSIASSADSTTITSYDGWKPLVDYDPSGNLVAANLYGPGADEILTRWVSALGTHLRYHHDVHGNVMFVLNDSGQGLERYTYDAFGTPKITDWDGYERTESAIGNRFMFQGREWIGELGIYDYRHRDYFPQFGRFLQMDPMGLQTEGAKLTPEQKALYGSDTPEAFASSEMNLFRYCGDDPVDRSDPFGLYLDIQGPEGFPKEVIRELQEEGAKSRDVQDAIQEAANSDKPHLIRPAESMGNRNPYGTAGPGHKAPRTDAYYGKPLISKSWWRSWLDTGGRQGSITYFDPLNWRSFDRIRPPGYALIHELGHILDLDRGTYIEQSAFGRKVPVAETRAIWWENQVRPPDDQRKWDDWGSEFR